MRQILIGAALAVLCATGALAQDKGAIEEVIRDQLDAFNDGDLARAWAHASPMIQGMFLTPENFGLMVQNGYPMVWSNSDAEFLDLRDLGGRLWQRVFIRDAQGAGYIAEYQMVETPEGWLINGVQIVPAPEVGV